jgi:exodeoxyribonuclease V gamma subunit
MLNLHFANRFETLADELVARLGEPVPGRSAFDADHVIVPSAAITRRLIIELARRQGICANVRFDYLASWLWRQTERLMPQLSKAARFEPEVFAWRILAAFEDASWSRQQPRLAAWLEHADPVMRHELAQRVAGLLDQYLTYRPEWLEAWFRNETVALPGADEGADLDQRWQAALWRRLAAETDNDGRHPFLALLQLLDARGIGLAGTGQLPASAHVFCLPTMPPVHLELLQRLGTHVDLHLYVLNPSQEFWFDVVDKRRLAWLGVRGEQQHHEEGNRLLAAWGRQTQSALSLLVEAADESAAADARYTAAAPGSVLGALHNAVLELVELAPGSLAGLAHDRSVEVHVCHSLTRELEVLHDRLLALMAGSNSPQPGDILVVTPDLDAAAPLIDAVFGTAPRERHLPYAISGRARAQVNAPARALLDVLALAASRFAVNDVFGLLQQPAVARRFGLAEDELDQIREWLVASGIHWALDAGHRGGFDVPAQARHSFADGLDRLFLGYALPGRMQAPFQGRLPAGDAEGSGALTLGAFWHFVEALKSLRERVAAPRSPAQWPAIVADVLQAFVAPAEPDLEDLREVDDAIARLSDQWQRSGLTHPLALDVVRAALEQALDDPARGGVPTGMITFAAMSSLRNVPFRVICAIGLDDGAFPTSARPAEFDLMTLAPRRGDRQRRLDERNVFLDLLLAARERLHLSYAGRSVRDNSVRPASVLVAELLETLLPALAPLPANAASRAKARAALVVEHPLQPFSSQAFEVGADVRIRSFQSDYAQALRQALAAPLPMPGHGATTAWNDDGEADDDTAAPACAAPFIARPLPPVDAAWRDVPMERLGSFLRNPCRFLLEQRLGVALRREDEELQDDEPFVPDNSGRAPLTRLLLPALLEGLPAEAARALALAGTAVPTGGFGTRFLERELDGLRSFAEQVREHTTQPALAPHACETTFVIDGQSWRLHGEFADLRPRGLLRYRYARQTALDYLDAWLPHLLLCASAPAGVLPVTTGIARDGRFFLNECDQPRAALETLVRLYARGLREPLAFFPKAAWEWINGDRQGPSKAIGAFRPGGFNEFAEGNDPGYRLALRGRPDPFSAEVVDEFYANATAVFEPLLACLERE